MRTVAQNDKMASNMINARAETIDQKASFKEPFLKRRCLIPADGFYEWTRNNDQKVPMRITLKSGEPFGFAGLWETWLSNNTDLKNLLNLKDPLLEGIIAGKSLYLGKINIKTAKEILG